MNESVTADAGVAALAESEAWRSIRLANFDDARADAAVEFAALAGLGEARARELLDAVLAHYHFRTAPYPAGLDRTLFLLGVHLTQPFRIPGMTARMDWAHARILSLHPAPGDRTALDYGGGGGKDSIVLSRWGYRTQYADLLSSLSPYVARRFALRRLDIAMHDVRDLPEERHDLVNCMDVIEHVYDVEQVTADVVARLKPGGLLLCYPAFFNSWDGDHVEKNCGYLPYFGEMLERIGVRTLALGEGVQLYRRERPVDGSVAAERETIRRELYRHSLQLSQSAALRGAWKLLLRFVGIHVLRRRSSLDPHLDTIMDNLAIRRLSRQRLRQSNRT